MRWTCGMVMAVLAAGCGAEDSGVAAPAPELDAGAPVRAPTQAASSPDAGAADAGPTFLYPVPDWTVAAPSQHGLKAAELEAAASVAAAEESYCLLVIRHGALVLERYFNGADAGTAHPSWSIAKSYTATLAAIALDRGELKGLDQSASDYVAPWRDTPRAAITLRHLLSMSSGLHWDAFEDYIGMASLAQDHTGFAVGKPLSSAPGSKWTYDNGGVQVLERVFRAATGGTVEQYAQARLWSKLGMSATWKRDPAGNPTTYANVLATCRDHARFGYLWLRRGVWAGEQLLSAPQVAAALAPSQPMNRAYGLLFWLNGQAPAYDAMNGKWPSTMAPFAPADLFAAHGFGNQFIDVIPSLDLVVVRFGKDPTSGGLDLAALAADAKFARHDRILAPVLRALQP